MIKLVITPLLYINTNDDTIATYFVWAIVWETFNKGEKEHI